MSMTHQTWHPVFFYHIHLFSTVLCLVILLKLDVFYNGSDSTAHHLSIHVTGGESGNSTATTLRTGSSAKRTDPDCAADDEQLPVCFSFMSFFFLCWNIARGAWESFFHQLLIRAFHLQTLRSMVPQLRPPNITLTMIYVFGHPGVYIIYSGHLRISMEIWTFLAWNTP